MTTQGSMRSEAELQVGALRAVSRGAVYAAGDDGYDEARTVYNADIDRRPALVARCRDVADVVHAVEHARRLDLPIAVRGGGHNVGGLGTCDGGVVVDLSDLRGVRVAPERRRARVEGGAVLGDLDHATHAFGLAVPAGIVSTTGVAGLTLGGGFGHLTRKYGLTSDNLRSVDVVTPAGDLVTADEERHADLFWALRGGGGNFGVVTSFELEARPVDTVLGGPIFWPLEAAPDVFRAYRDLIRDAPWPLGAFISFHVVPPVEPFPAKHHGRTMCAVVVCYDGPAAEGREALRPLLDAAPPAFDLTRPLPYPRLQTMFDDLLPHGLYHYWKTVFLRELSEEAIAAHLEHGPRVANIHTTMHMYPLNGAVHRVGPRETAFGYRDVQFAVNIVGVGRSREELDTIRPWVRGYWGALAPHSAGTGYVNFLMGDEALEVVRRTFGENFDRLAAVKARYDPDNRLCINHNIPPIPPESRAA